MSNGLNPTKALIFRITHRDNVPWIMDNGIHSRASSVIDPNFVEIGNPDLITKRRSREVPTPTGGSLSEYVPFYFTPHSPMIYNITTGFHGITKRRNEEIVILASSLRKMEELGIAFVFADRHAYSQAANFSSDTGDLDNADWGILQARNFRNDPDNPERKEKYQAEALIHRHVPNQALLGIICYDSDAKNELTAVAAKRGLDSKIEQRPNWYFR